MLENEVNTLNKMDHINIIKIYDVFYYQSFFYVVTEYCGGGNLLEALKMEKIRSYKILAIILKQLMSAVFYIHSKLCAHRDIKLENIMLVHPL